MDNFYSLTKEEQTLIDETMPENYLPSIVIRSHFREARFTHLLKGVLGALKYDFEKYGNPKAGFVNLEDEYGYASFPKYVAIIYLSPEAHKLFLEHRWHIFKFKRIQKWDEDQIEILFKNEIGQYFDALSLPIAKVDKEDAGDVCKYIEKYHPEVNAKAKYKNDKALISFTVVDRNTDRSVSKPKLQSILSKHVENRFNAQFVDLNGNEIDEVVVPQRPSKTSKKNRDRTAEDIER